MVEAAVVLVERCRFGSKGCEEGIDLPWSQSP